ncbi:hypothetical protein MTO96_024556 [Rhipicephalus appendiculatus]
MVLSSSYLCTKSDWAPTRISGDSNRRKSYQWSLQPFSFRVIRRLSKYAGVPFKHGTYSSAGNASYNNDKHRTGRA